ncbi:SOS response-associated peptidase [Roseivirga echinicomitans]
MRRKIKEAIHKGATNAELEFLRVKLDQFIQAYGEEELAAHEHHWTMGFQHQKIPVITNEQPEALQFYQWGLIPSWAKDAQAANEISNKCLNARADTLFEKPAFRSAAKDRRCIVAVSGYYEHHWVDSKGKTKVPYFVKQKNEAPLYLAGLWESWTDKETGEEVRTCSIVTTSANERLTRVHNRKPDDPRMLVVLPFAKLHDWLAPIDSATDIALLKSLCIPFEDELLDIYPVRTLRGNAGVGNTAQASERFEYPIIGLPENN